MWTPWAWIWPHPSLDNNQRTLIIYHCSHHSPSVTHMQSWAVKSASSSLRRPKPLSLGLAAFLSWRLTSTPSLSLPSTLIIF